MLNGRSILITGGTGSFGQKFVAEVFKRYPDVKKVVVFSRDELKQSEMRERFPQNEYPQIRFFLGDVRDKDRLYRAFSRIDVVVHAAALKQVPAAEYNPMEFVKTNVMGAENIINAAMDTGVQRLVALSTDKAAAPINLYGATKLCSDKLFIAANNFAGMDELKFSVVRYGNVMGSRGSVVPFFLKKKKDGVIPITDKRMTRFNIPLDKAVDLVFHAIENSWGGELFVPKVPSFRVTDMAEAIAPDCEQRGVGIRPGEKLHEELITASDSYYTYDIGKYYVILPHAPLFSTEEYLKEYEGTPVEQGFQYNSGTNDQWLTVADLEELVAEYQEQKGKNHRAK